MVSHAYRETSGNLQPSKTEAFPRVFELGRGLTLPIQEQFLLEQLEAKDLRGGSQAIFGSSEDEMAKRITAYWGVLPLPRTKFGVTHLKRDKALSS